MTWQNIYNHLSSKYLNKLLNMAKEYHDRGNLREALNTIQKAEELAFNDEDLLIIYTMCGVLCSQIGYLEEAISYHNKALALCHKLKKDKNIEAIILDNLGVVHSKKGDHKKAIKYHEESLNLQTDEREKIATYNNLGVLYATIGDYTKAKEYYTRALELSRKIDNNDAYLIIINLGYLYIKLKNYEKALSCLMHGLNMSKAVKDKYREAIVYKYLVEFYFDKADFEEANFYYKLAMDTFSSIGAFMGTMSMLDLAVKRKLYVIPICKIEIDTRSIKAKYILRALFKNPCQQKYKKIERFLSPAIENIKDNQEKLIEFIASEVKDIIKIMRKKGVAKENIFITVSAELEKIVNINRLLDKIRELKDIPIEEDCIRDADQLWDAARAVFDEVFNELDKE